ncbi:MAG: hypothetical protein ACI9IP_001163, partial [Arcticibacterium sp.]
GFEISGITESLAYKYLRLFKGEIVQYEVVFDFGKHWLSTNFIFIFVDFFK